MRKGGTRASRNSPQPFFRFMNIGFITMLMFFYLMGVTMLLAYVLPALRSFIINTKDDLKANISEVNKTIQSYVSCLDEVCAEFPPLVDAAALWRGCFNSDTGITYDGIQLMDGVGERGDIWRACTNRSDSATFTLGGYPPDLGDLFIFDDNVTEWLYVDGSAANFTSLQDQINAIDDSIDIINGDIVTINNEIANITANFTGKITMSNPGTSYGNVDVLQNPGTGDNFNFNSFQFADGISLTVAVPIIRVDVDLTVTLSRVTTNEMFGADFTAWSTLSPGISFTDVETRSQSAYCGAHGAIVACSCAVITVLGNSMTTVPIQDVIPTGAECACNYEIYVMQSTGSGRQLRYYTDATCILEASY